MHTSTAVISDHTTNRLMRTIVSLLVVVIMMFQVMTVYADSFSKRTVIRVFDPSQDIESGEGGIWHKIILEISEKEQWDIQYSTGTLEQGMKKLTAGDIDILYAVPSGSSTSYAWIMGQEAVISTWAEIYTHSNKPLQSLNALDNQVVGVLQNDFNNPESRKILKGLSIDIRFVEFENGTDLKKAFDRKWIDATVVDRFFAATKMREYRLNQAAIFFSPMEYRFAATKDNKETILDIIDFHLRAMKQDSRSDYNTYLGGILRQDSQEKILKLFKIGLGATVICLLLLFIHSSVLRYKVKKKTIQLATRNNELNEELEKRHKAEMAQRESENNFRRLFEASVEGIAIYEVIWDEDGNMVDCIFSDINPMLSKQMGFERNQVIGEKATMLSDCLNIPHFKDFIFHIFHGEPQQHEAHLDKLDKDFFISFFPLDHDHFATVCEDITEKRKAETAIRASDEKYRLLVENAHDLIIVARGKTMKYANPTALENFGYTPDTIGNLNLEEIVHPEDRGSVFDLKRMTMTSKKKHHYHTFRALTKSGESRWMHMNVVPIEWEGLKSSLCLMRDITESRKLEAQLLQAQKMQAIGTLAGGMAHDFNNILAAIIGYTELCQLETSDHQELSDNLEQIFKAGQRAKDLVNQILTFSHQREKELKPIEIKYPVKEALKLIKATIPSTIEIKEFVRNEPGIVVSDMTQIHQIVMNLCTNAAHAMEEKGGVLEISLKNVHVDKETSGMIRNLKPGSYVCLSVSDSGHGMPPAVLERIFEPYFTTKKQGHGTGMGLAMIHGIVESMGGVIKVYSESGFGTTFDVYFPRVNVQSESMVTVIGNIPRGKESILLVDDEEIVLNMTREILINLGYNVTSRVSSVEALKFFKSNSGRIDLVVTDQTMPGMTGKDLAEQIMKIRPDFPVILCTGFSASVDEKRALTIGVKAFLKKPILRTDLARTVRKVLDDSFREQRQNTLNVATVY